MRLFITDVFYVDWLNLMAQWGWIVRLVFKVFVGEIQEHGCGAVPEGRLYSVDR